MAFLLFFQLLAVLTLASGKPILFPRLAQDASLDDAQPSFDVALESLGNTSVKAQITNLGTQGFRVVQRGGLLDQFPTKKVTVHSADGGTDPTFTGVLVEYILSHLTPEGFAQISPNQTVASIFDIADLYELTAGQEYTAFADGILEYTTLADTTKFQRITYKSNTISFIAPTEASSTNNLEDRSTLICSDEYKSLVEDAVSRAADMATAAAEDARTPSPLFQKFFKSSSQSDADEVSGRLSAIATEARATGAGKLTYYCQPTEDDYCAGNVAAITYPTLSRVVNCPGYYTSTRESNYCGYLDQAGITLHEFAHATAVYAPGTDDIAYGWDGVLALNTAQAKNNADSFAYYASAVYLQCAVDDSKTIGTPVSVGIEASSTATLGVSIGGGTSSTSTSDDDNDNDNDDDNDNDTDSTTTNIPTTTVIPIVTITSTVTVRPTQTATETTTETWTVQPTETPTTTNTPSSGTGPDTGSGWNFGDSGFGNGNGDDNNYGSHSGSGVAATSTPDCSSTPAPVTTASGVGLFTLQDLLDWLRAQYESQGQSQSQDQSSYSESGSDSGYNVKVKVESSTSVA
ncbi:Deuterolysin metalloprotease family-domain-containing protein [Aspergillus californicus]